MHVPPVDDAAIHKLAQIADRGKAEVAAMRPKTNWLARMGKQLLEENHLSDRIRQSLGD